MAMKKLLILPLLFLLCFLLRPADSAGAGAAPWPAWHPPAQQYPPAVYYPSSPGNRRPWDPFVYGRCVGSFVMEGSCEGQIMASFWTGRVFLGPGCCESVQRVTDECVTTAFAALANPYFGYALKGYCATRPWVQSLH